MVKIHVILLMSFKLRYSTFRISIGAALKLAFFVQRPTWSSPKGPGLLFDDDDNISITPRKNKSGTSALLAKSDTTDDDEGGQISAGSEPNQMPEFPPQGQRKMTSEPPKSHLQKVYDYEVCECVSRLKVTCINIEYFRNLSGGNQRTSLQRGHLVNSASSMNWRMRVLSLLLRFNGHPKLASSIHYPATSNLWINIPILHASSVNPSKSLRRKHCLKTHSLLLSLVLS
jgi:hypothetical protein